MPSARAAYALRRLFSVHYELEEHPVGLGADWRGSGAFERLLASGMGLLEAADPDGQALQFVVLTELLGVAGWRRIGHRLSDGVQRVVVDQAVGARTLRLTARELAASQLAALGYKSRRIGAELGIAAATARGAVDRAVAKLQLASSIQLPLLWYTLASPARRIRGESGGRYLVFEREVSVLASDRLTKAERSLVERLLLGDSYRGIAAHRAVSVRTVANQMSRLYEKFEVSSRAELVVLLLASGG